MTQEQKDLLLKDLCARLPYEVKVSVNDKVEIVDGISVLDNVIDYGSWLSSEVEEVKPYLFPLESMTEEQKEEYCNLQQKIIYNSKGLINSDIMEYVNWCYKNHIDINNLISLGLAIDATNLNIY